MRIWTRKSTAIQPRASLGKSDGVVAGAHGDGSAPRIAAVCAEAEASSLSAESLDARAAAALLLLARDDAVPAYPPRIHSHEGRFRKEKRDFSAPKDASSLFK